MGPSIKTYGSLVLLILVLGGGFYFLGGGKDSERVHAFFKGVTTNTETVIAKATEAGKTVSEAAGTLGSSLLGGEQPAPAVTFKAQLEETFQSLIGTGNSLQTATYEGSIFETLTPYETLVGVEEYFFTTSQGDVRFYYVERVDDSIENIYDFLLSLALGPNANDDVLIQETSSFTKPAFYYIHLDKTERVRIVSTVTEDIVLAVDAPIAMQYQLQSLMNTLN